jgi:SAM-dependent methyltransferase
MDAFRKISFQALASGRETGNRAAVMEGSALRTGNIPLLWHSFGCEYAESPRWNRWERLFIRIFGQVDLPSRMRARLIQKVLRKIPWKTMIDFGCGIGMYAFFFTRSAAKHVWGLDIDKSRITECIELNNRLERKSLDFICTSGIFEHNRFQPDSMDVVLSVEVLLDLPDLQAGLHDIQRVLKTGGYLIAQIPAPGCRRKHEAALYDTDKLSPFLKEAGFEPVSVKRVFGRTADFLCRIFSLCSHSRFFTAFVFPALLMASLLCGGENSNGSYYMIIARKRG